ncbi:hypothetical protein GCM10009119_23520 [Algoriphagus jejuensis]|uniref:Phage tail-like protein n=1 Tax=Algoriphagus jejuensis TaxID=419934 RepID=A0ABP3YG35_9BACT
MAGEAQDGNWPLPKFYFSVDWGTMKNIPFQEISGLEIEGQTPEYRHGNSPVFSAVKMPGIVKSNHVTMKKGVFVNDDVFRDWYNRIKMNTIDRQTVVVKLLDESGASTMTWTLANASPTKIIVADLVSNSNEVAVEYVEIFHEGLTIANS